MNLVLELSLKIFQMTVIQTSHAKLEINNKTQEQSQWKTYFLKWVPVTKQSKSFCYTETLTDDHHDMCKRGSRKQWLEQQKARSDPEAHDQEAGQMHHGIILRQTL